MQHLAWRVLAPMIRKSRSALVVVVLLTLTVRCVGDGLREDELECERAAVHVAECCPGTRSIAWACPYIEGGEGCLSSPPVDPILGRVQGVCLQKASCADIVAGGVCAAVTAGALNAGGSAGASGGGAGGVGGAKPAPDPEPGGLFEEDNEPLDRKALRKALEQRTVCP